MLMVLLAVVVVSGVIGLTLQQSLPRRLLELVPHETVPTQIASVREQLREEAEELVQAAFEPSLKKPAARREEDAPALLSYLPADVSRAAVRPQARPGSKPAGAPSPDVEPLRRFYQSTVAPFLREPGRSPLRSSSEAALLFVDLKDALEPALLPTVEALEGLCERRRQLDVQARLQFWLHSWLCVHLPLSAALVVLMFVHAWVAVKYW
jgi:hypothetical protein